MPALPNLCSPREPPSRILAGTYSPVRMSSTHSPPRSSRRPLASTRPPPESTWPRISRAATWAGSITWLRATRPSACSRTCTSISAPFPRLGTVRFRSRATCSELQAHPRTADNLEVMRRWEEARLSQFFSSEQIEAFREGDQEHILLVNETGGFELQPYEQIPARLEAVRTFGRSSSNVPGRRTWCFGTRRGRRTLKSTSRRVRFTCSGSWARKSRSRKTNGGVTIPYGDRQYCGRSAPRGSTCAVRSAAGSGRPIATRGRYGTTGFYPLRECRRSTFWVVWAPDSDRPKNCPAEPTLARAGED